MYKVSDLDRRICDVEPEAVNEQTYREWIHDISVYIYDCDCVTDEELNNMTDEELTDLIDELDWLADK
jgi:hypothetical protein